MMNKIHFDWLPLVEKMFDGDQIISIIKVGLNNSGFISGGGARTIGRLIAGSVGVLPDKIVSNRNLSEINVETFLKDYFKFYSSDPGSRNPYWKAESGDIDIFFSSENGASRAIERVSEIVKNGSDWLMTPTEAGWGHDVSTPNYRCQLITRETGTPEYITGTFDIINGTCWLSEDSFHFSDEWLRLEQENKIGLQGPCTKHNLAWRVSKWIWRGNYSSIHEGSQKKYIENCISTMKEIKSGQGLKRFGRQVKPSSLKSKLRDISMQTLTNENLLLASFLLDDYEQPEIFKFLADKNCCENS